MGAFGRLDALQEGTLVMGRILDLTGQRFSRLVALGNTMLTSSGSFIWQCKCDCGRLKMVSARNLKQGQTQSCGCLQGDLIRKRGAITHGHHTGGPSPTYRSWVAAKSRCFNPNLDHYRYYGGRGITMCQEWVDSFEAFLRDMGPRPEGLTLDRIENDGNYEPENCRWATIQQQNNNQRGRI